MPYIIKSRRQAIFNDSTTDYDNKIRTSGELNYFITEILVEYLQTQGLNYQTCNDIVGALDNCKNEFKRRIQDPYENKKIKENGDVYPKDILKLIKKKGK